MNAEGSWPEFEVYLKKNILIPMPDGVQLAADIFLPKTPGPFPGLLNCTPYRKDDLSAAGLRYHRHLARYGFGVVRLDMRGTGKKVNRRC